jgi:hypothetical protein
LDDKALPPDLEGRALLLCSARVFEGRAVKACAMLKGLPRFA